MAAKAKDAGITYVAFTATPKAKTLENFGRRPDPTKPAAKDNLPRPFHVYSMQQAIEEGFILDVLRNYISYKLAFKLAHEPQGASRGCAGKDDEPAASTLPGAEKPAASAVPLTEWDERQVEHAEAMKGLMRWVRLHPYNISQKVKIVVEHFRELVAHLIKGKAKAMVVTSSRVEAVRWQLAINKYITEQGYPIRTLVAFSGEVEDKESGPDSFKETSTEMNPNLKGRQIREAFKGDEFQILLVANKFQTGFDQPFLCAMYVDKKLAGIQAVQTLSRLNRCHPGKDTTYVLDFVNNAQDVLEAFKTYYQTATLEDVTDPTIVLNLRTKLDDYGFYDEPEIERVVAIEFDPKAKQKQLEAAIAPVADRLLKQFKAAKEELKDAETKRQNALAENPNADVSIYEKAAQKAKDKMNVLLLFRADMSTYQRVYTFLSQIFDYNNTDFEKRSIFYRYLLRLLKFGREREGVDLSQVVLTHHNLRNKGRQNMKLKDDQYPELAPLSEAGSSTVREQKKALLREIIEKVNDLFKGDLTDNDKLVYVNNVIKGKLLESETLIKQANSNSKQQFSNSPDLNNEITNAIIEALDAHESMSTQALGSKALQHALKEILLGPAKLYELLRGEIDEAA